MKVRPSFRFIGSGKFAGTVREDDEFARTVARCPHGHRTARLALDCATATLIPSMSEETAP